MEIDSMNIDENESHSTNTNSNYRSFDLETYASNYKGWLNKYFKCIIHQSIINKKKK